MTPETILVGDFNLEYCKKFNVNCAHAAMFKEVDDAPTGSVELFHKSMFLLGLGS